MPSRAALLSEQALRQLFLTHLQVGRYVCQDAAQRADAQAAVSRDSDVVLGALRGRGQPEVAPRLPRDLIP